jgi:uncharacterized protein (UPF0332 family)
MKEVQELMVKAKRSLKAAWNLFREEDYDFAVSRAYYAMLYTTEAALLTKGLTFSKHKGVIAGFWQHFVKPGIFDRSLHKGLNDAFKMRNLGDYGYEIEISEERAQEILQSAKEFLFIVGEYLEQKEMSTKEEPEKA